MLTDLSSYKYANEYIYIYIFIAFNLSFLRVLWNYEIIVNYFITPLDTTLLFRNSFRVYVLNHFHHEILIFYLYQCIFKKMSETTRKKESSTFYCGSISNEYKQRKRLFCFLILNMNIVQTFFLLRKTLAVCRWSLPMIKGQKLVSNRCLLWK